MKVRDVMIRNVITLSPKTSYEEAARILYGNHISGAPVVNERGTIVGMISEKDLFRALYPTYAEYCAEPQAFYDWEGREHTIEQVRSQPIERYMSEPAVTVDESDPILRAGGLMLAHSLHRLPVTRHGALAGIVTREAIYQTILQHQLFSRYRKVATAIHQNL
ncbi:MAG TPA: CBS domain-containing protein [Candidatus Paceibacterota bacterium]|nr:CBS domain-containing protein [Candidatus Paceibacterota bacterium]